jgi:phage baseplate assembly protein W
MAIELGKVNVTDLAVNDYKVLGIGINETSNTGGIFSKNFTTLTQAKSNLTNLIMTKKGERVAQPDFGCDIWKVLFEQIIDGEIDYEVERVISEAVNIWLPYLEINEIIVDYNDEYKDANKFGVEINFSLKSNKNLSESVKINVNN